MLIEFTKYFSIKELGTILLILAVQSLIIGCEHNISDQSAPDSNNLEYTTENVIIIVIDGPRFKETWGDPLKKHIPHFANELAVLGINHNRFYNRGATYTTSGHAAITTGNYQWMANDGSEIPYYPSIFQLWLESTRENSNKAQIVTSKQKLEVLADCASPEWRGKFNPQVNAIDRTDNDTYQMALSILKENHPRMMLIHFRGPDLFGHANDWDNYLKSIEETDLYTFEIWKFLQNDLNYQNTTTLMVTNDHGRHNDDVRNGFVGHGDFCEGCTHINLYAAGPDFHSNMVVNQPRHAVDISATIAEIMDFTNAASTGAIMWELFK